MSHRSRDRNLSEWADLVGASLPDSVEDSNGTSASGDAYRSPESFDAFGTEFGSETDRSR
ncbi:hypothetical protein [Halobellus clavatus]|jgi:hypothetical protein|uniref:Uncharacterized protein n=1 Tax=Halobellus clavatus TaxID=660517 RepID=A0A1H3E5K0_9EURY|nr:hypothetical protein [Halobellus clavatus]SDX73961.1 hypothetical protein SAMN04487946_10262 [Halobellus clavatus]